MGFDANRLMGDFMNYFDTLHDGDKESLADIVLCAMLKANGPVRILEIGSATGVSSAIIAKTIKTCGDGHLWCVDAWSLVWGKEGEFNDSFPRWEQNMIEEGVLDIITPVKGFSHDVVDQFEDGFFDMIFVDGDHRYSGVMADLKAYYPKLKAGGVICGHDLELRWDALSPRLKALFDENLENQDSPIYGMFPGVIKAVHQFFGCNGYTVLPCRIWSAI